MIIVIQDDDFIIKGHEDCRLAVKILKVEKSKKYLIGYKFKFQFLVLKDAWKEVIRIDNYPHGKTIGKTHIHKFDGTVREIKIDLEEIEDYIIKLGIKLKEELI